ncbi:DUF2796 domain-containing protein [Leptothrix discophora]|uniref:DUF2796 domain-containing protein n=1 Tax=Leptothrix discophora TaxID=89 RepID=A0ABT9G486_LEPDI|nr:DUF2796 domain-containing protein [Leptothrix discophora]MDP4301298.1 DUF2796 domain-containing protein [Leptothrix discophora]
MTTSRGPRALFPWLMLAASPCLVGLAGPARAQSPAAHQHGQVDLAIGLDGPMLTLALEAPLDSLVGFEHAPRTAAQRQLAQALLARLRVPTGLFTPDPAAGCTPGAAELDAGVLEPGAKPSANGHAELSATYTWTCTSPAALRSVDLAGLMSAAPRIARVNTQVAGPQGQFKVTLRRPATVLRWGR